MVGSGYFVFFATYCKNMIKTEYNAIYLCLLLKRHKSVDFSQIWLYTIMQPVGVAHSGIKTSG